MTPARGFTESFKDGDFGAIVRASLVTLCGKVTGVALALVATIIVARFYGAESLGKLASLNAVLALGTTGCLLGTRISIVRIISEQNIKNTINHGYNAYLKAQRLVILASLILGAIFLVGAFLIKYKSVESQYYPIMVTAAACLAFQSLGILNTEALRALGDVRKFTVLQAVPHAAMVLCLISIVPLRTADHEPLYAQLFAWFATACIAMYFVRTEFRMAGRSNGNKQIGNTISTREILALSLPMLLSGGMHLVIGQSAIIVLGVFHEQNEVGTYAVAVKLATMTAFVLNAINGIVAPRYSAHYQRGEIGKAIELARRSAKFIFLMTAPVLAVLLYQGGNLVKIAFGEEFGNAYPPMVILIIGQIFNICAGSTGYFMNMTGNHLKLRNIMLSAAAVNLLICLALIPQLGMHGAAVAASVTNCLWNVQALRFIKRAYGRSVAYVPLLSSSLKISDE